MMRATPLRELTWSPWTAPEAICSLISQRASTDSTGIRLTPLRQTADLTVPGKEVPRSYVASSTRGVGKLYDASLKCLVAQPYSLFLLRIFGWNISCVGVGLAVVCGRKRARGGRTMTKIKTVIGVLFVGACR